MHGYCDRQPVSGLLQQRRYENADMSLAVNIFDDFRNLLGASRNFQAKLDI